MAVDPSMMQAMAGGGGGAAGPPTPGPAMGQPNQGIAIPMAPAHAGGHRGQAGHKRGGGHVARRKGRHGRRK
jgi:hypothetical protein